MKTEYERIRSENDDLQVRLDKERESKSRLEIRIKNLEAEIIEITKTESVSNSSSKEINPTEAILLQKLNEKNLLKDFIHTCTQINKGSAIRNDYAPKDYFVELGLIVYSNDYSYESKFYKITNEGNSILKKARRE